MSNSRVGSTYCYGAIKYIVAFLFIFASIASYICTLYFVWKAYTIGKWSMRPELEELEEYSQSNPTAVMHFWVAKQCQVSIKENTPKLERKAHFLSLSLRTLPLEAVFLALASVISLIVQKGS